MKPGRPSRGRLAYPFVTYPPETGSRDEKHHAHQKPDQRPRAHRATQFKAQTPLWPAKRIAQSKGGGLAPLAPASGGQQQAAEAQKRPRGWFRDPALVVLKIRAGINGAGGSNLFPR